MKSTGTCKARKTPRRRIVRNVPQATVGLAAGPVAWPRAETVWCVRGLSPSYSVHYRKPADLLRYGYDIFGDGQLRAAVIAHLREYPDGALGIVGMSKAEEEEAAAYEARTGEKVLFGWRKLSWVLG